MKITKESDYALRIVLFLCKKGMDTKTDAKTIGELENVTLRFTLKILRKLTQAGITKSFRGVHGGYSLAKSPETVTMLEVIEVIEGNININACLGNNKLCNAGRASFCTLHQKFKFAQEELRKNLTVTFESIMNTK